MNVKYCTQCGNERPAKSSFCPICGVSFAAADKSEIQIATSKLEVSEELSTARSARKKLKKRTLASFLCAVVLLAGFPIWYLSANKQTTIEPLQPVEKVLPHTFSKKSCSLIISGVGSLNKDLKQFHNLKNHAQAMDWQSQLIDDLEDFEHNLQDETPKYSGRALNWINEKNTTLNDAIEFAYSTEPSDVANAIVSIDRAFRLSDYEISYCKGKS